MDLSSSDSDVTVPSFVVIAAGTTSASFEIQTSIVHVEKDVRLTATVAASLQATASQVLAVLKLRPPRPRLDSVAPANALPGTSVNVTLTGAMFIPGATVTVSGSGVSVSGVVIDNLSSMRATLTVASSATTGERQITVVTRGGSSAATFTVGNAPAPPRPTITSVLPPDLRRSTFGGMALSGTNFTPGSTVEINGTGVTLDPAVYINSTALALGYSASADAPLGPRMITVTSAAGTSEGITINVLGQIPTVKSFSPSSAVAGTSVDVTIIGEHFVPPVTIQPLCDGVTVTNVTFLSSTQIAARFTIASTAVPFPCFMRVTTSGWPAGSHFNILPLPPTITSINPNPYTGPRGAVDLVISGQHYWGVSAVAVSGSGVTVSSVFTVSATSLRVRVVLEPGFTYGDRDVIVTASGGTSNAFRWSTVAPTLTSRFLFRP